MRWALPQADPRLVAKEDDMDRQVREALGQFFAAQRKLNQLGIIHSRDYVGDIARYLCTVVYGMEPAGRRASCDGTIGPSRIRVCFNNCPVGHPVKLDEPLEYDEAIVVLGPNSSLRPEGVDAEFILYRFDRDEISARFKTPRGQFVGRRDAFAQGYDRVVSLEQEPTR
jgi:hypothetical protein